MMANAASIALPQPSVPQEQEPKYDPIAISKAADDKYFNENDLEGAQLIFQTALLEWQDDAREGQHVGMDLEQMRQAIASLWLSYAHFNRKARQNKSCVEAYEAAVGCDVARSMGRIWLDYARYYEEREKYSSAQKIYLRALTGIGKPGEEQADGNAVGAVQDHADRDTLWREYLRMMQEKRKDPDLTLEKLKEAVMEEHVAVAAAANAHSALGGKEGSVSTQVAPESPGAGNGSIVLTQEAEVPLSKRPKLTVDSMSTSASSQPKGEPSKEEQIATASRVEANTVSLMTSTETMPPELAAAWMASDGNSHPMRPEPPLFSPSPPKLSDASGKDLLGSDLALQLVQLLLKEKTGDGKDIDGNSVLEISKGCWTMYALKEREATKKLREWDKKMAEDLSALEENLTARESVAGGAIEAVKQVNQSERNEFLSTCTQHRQQLIDSLTWEFRQLLCLQQQILTAANIPTFQGPTIDSSLISLHAKVCSVMHSAFVLRGKVGESAHKALLATLEGRLKAASQDPALREAPPMQEHGKPVVARVSPPPPPPLMQHVPASTNPLPMMGQQPAIPPPMLGQFPPPPVMQAVGYPQPQQQLPPFPPVGNQHPPPVYAPPNQGIPPVPMPPPQVPMMQPPPPQQMQQPQQHAPRPKKYGSQRSQNKRHHQKRKY